MRRRTRTTRRAPRSALSIGKALDARRAWGDIQLQTRIGVATGLVVIGEIGIGTAAAEYSASGETPNLAARCPDLRRARAVFKSLAS